MYPNTKCRHCNLEMRLARHLLEFAWWSRGFHTCETYQLTEHWPDVLCGSTYSVRWHDSLGTALALDSPFETNSSQFPHNIRKYRSELAKLWGCLLTPWEMCCRVRWLVLCEDNGSWPMLLRGMCNIHCMVGMQYPLYGGYAISTVWWVWPRLWPSTKALHSGF